jgi:hypothetical protein
MSQFPTRLSKKPTRQAGYLDPLARLATAIIAEFRADYETSNPP